MSPTPCFLVTGSTSGIGFATAARLAQSPTKVFVTGRTADTVGAAVSTLGLPLSRVEGLTADLHGAEGIDPLLGALRERGHVLEGLVLAHGGDQVPEIFESSSAAEFEKLTEAVFLSNARLAHGAIPLLREFGRGASMVVVTSDAARFPTTGEVMIGALAAANLMFVRTLAREAARDGIRINAVTVTLTKDTRTYERVLNASEFSRRLFSKAAERMPLAPVRADDVAATIEHLLGAGCAKVTGQVVGVTGGLST